MKKTFITLAAVAMLSVASAVEPVYSTASPTPGTTNITYAGKYAFTLSVVIDMDKALSNETDLGAYNNIQTSAALQQGGAHWTNGFAVWDADDRPNDIFIAIRDGGVQANMTSSEGVKWAGGCPYYGSGDAYNGKLVLTYTYVAGEANSNGHYPGTQTLYILKNDGNGNLTQDTLSRATAAWAIDSYEEPFKQMLVQDPHGVMDSLYIFESALSADEAKTFATTLLKGTPAIPEPATATLSLLALAGLAARRRRK